MSVRGFSNETPLHLAAHKGQIEACNFLLSNGARYNQSDKYGVKPVDFSIYNREVKKLFKEYVTKNSQ
jgi:ankyrin repeat protein